MIEKNTQEAILAEFDRAVGLYEALAKKAHSLVEDITQGGAVQIHSITKRAKTRASLARKLAKPDKTYELLSDVTDIAAVRITTYFAEDVDSIAHIIENEFQIDHQNSVDKRAMPDPERFGYQSLHYIAEFSDARCGFVEYSRFRSIRFEIQVRSILQHAWAEIEHDLGYKSAAAIPREFRRRFSRIAGLLELADDEFAAIRRGLDAYAATVEREIRDEPSNVGVDKLSLLALVSTQTSAARLLSEAVARSADSKLVRKEGANHLLEALPEALRIIGINTIAELEDAARKNVRVVDEFSKQWIQRGKHETLDMCIGVLYLAYVLVAERRDANLARKFAENLELADAEGFFGRLIATLNQVTTG